MGMGLSPARPLPIRYFFASSGNDCPEAYSEGDLNHTLLNWGQLILLLLHHRHPQQLPVQDLEIDFLLERVFISFDKGERLPESEVIFKSMLVQFL